MSATRSFGHWLKQRRKALDLTQEALARKVGCAVVTLQKIEGDDRRPSRLLAERLAQCLDIPEAKRAEFILFARGTSSTAPTLGESPLLQLNQWSSALPPLIGRSQEIEWITQHLQNGKVRLLTLVGLGGIGKTHLAIEAARQIPNVWFVPLQPLDSPDFIVSTVASAIGFQFYSRGDPKQQLLDYLREKAWLLILDNFEHLLDGAMLLSEILAYAPAMRLLVTSRERLNLTEEWVLDVGALSYPSNENDREPERYSAIELFVQHAQRAKVGFTLTDANRFAVARICRLVGGMPLGIGLAASWVRSLSCEAIADEIERSLDILETPVRNVEPRHRTMRAAFEPTWNRLTNHERTVFMWLSVFHGGFTHEAAESVTGASLRTLMALVDKSLVLLRTNQRYDLHDLLRQYAEEQLAASGQIEAARDAHCAYYANVLAESDDLSTWANQRKVEVLKQEAENFRAAIRRAIDTRQLVAMERLLWVLKALYYERAWFQEKVELARLAVETLRHGLDAQDTRQIKMIGGYLHSWAVGLQYLGQIEEARMLAQESLAILLPIGASRELSHTYNTLSQFATDPHEQRDLMVKAIEHGRAINYGYALAAYTANLGSIAVEEGAYDEAKWLAGEALVTCRERGYVHSEAFTLRLLGTIALRQKQYAEAKHWVQRALINHHQTGFWGAITDEALLGHIAFLERNGHEASLYFQAMLAKAKDLGIPPAMAEALNGLSRVACQFDDLPEARARWLEALQIAERVQDTALLLESLETAAELLASEGAIQESFQLICFTLQHPKSDWRLRHLAEALYDKLAAHFALNELTAIREHSKGLTLENLVKAVKARLLKLQVEPTPISVVSLERPVLESLSARELEIVRLIAEGLSNAAIAQTLYISTATVKVHVRNIFSKLYVSNRTQMVTQARRLNLI